MVKNLLSRLKTAAILLLVAALLFALPLPLFAGDSFQDKALLAAYEAYLARDEAGLARHGEKLQGHSLALYGDFWRLRLRLEEANPADVRVFLTRHAGTVLAEQLRREWLLLLGKTGQWESFRQERPALEKDDPEIACYTLQERWLRRDAAALSEAKLYWRLPKPLPEGCLPLADEMLKSGQLTPKELSERFRLLVQANLMSEAKAVAGPLAGKDLPGESMDRIAKAPAKFLERSALDLETPLGRESAIAALIRLSQSDLPGALQHWNGSLREKLSREDQRYLWAVLGAAGARRGLPEALDWFVNAGDTPLTDDQLAWQARVALRQEAWTVVKGAIDRMSPPARREPTWIYWRGRALCALGAAEEGEALFGAIAGGDHFYGRLAAEELGMPLRFPPQEPAPRQEELEQAGSLPGLQRSLLLYRLGLRNEAKAEWIWTVRAMSDRELLAAAELAHRNGIWDRAINTAEKTVDVHDFALRYPIPYRDILSRQAKIRSLEEPWVFGLVRQESRFLLDARSPMGASGLMQLLPATARWVAKMIGLKGFNLSWVNRPEVNAALGTFYLRHVLDGFNGNPVLASAAYNAGPSRARQWRGTKPLEGAIYIETIPFPETRQYVKKVMANTVSYAALLGQEPRTLKSRLGTIP
jgi:soluble lytic murein transglycosylase